MGVALGPWQQERERHARSLLQALSVSVAVHAGLLLVLADVDAPSRRMVFPPPLVARLVSPLAPPAPAQMPSQPLEPERAPVARAPEPPALAKSTPQRTPLTRLAESAPAPVAQLPPSQASAPALSSTQSPAPPVASPAPAVATPAVAAPPELAAAPAAGAKGGEALARLAPDAQPDLGTLEEYQKAVRIAAARYKRYPRVAIDNNWEGSVVVRLSIGAGGAVSALAVSISTGHEVLDREALDMVRQAAPQVPLPAALRGKAFGAEIRVIFSLRDAAG